MKREKGRIVKKKTRTNMKPDKYEEALISQRQAEEEAVQFSRASAKYMHKFDNCIWP